MEELKLQRIKFYTIDLTKIKGRGDVKCPKCGISISPDDENEDVYTILEPVVRGNYLEKIILKCIKCESQIHLTGFQVFSKKRSQ